MPREQHTPFRDLHSPPRSKGQIALDRLRNQEQIARLMVGTTPAGAEAGSQIQTETSEVDDQGKDELVRILFERREEAGAGVVLLDVAPTDTEQWSLIVPGQLIVREAPQSLSPVAAQILGENKFLVQNGFGASPLCPELAGRLTVYNYTGGLSDDTRGQRNRDMRVAMGRLESEAAVRAAPTLVTALQKVIVKAAIGPAPTTVTTSQAFKAAGVHAPAGDVVVAVIDTGIANVRRADGWLNEVPGGPGRIDPLDAFPAPGNGKLDFAAGHGTFAAGIVRLVDPDARIRVYTALDSDGFADETTIACAMIQAVKDGADVLNLSFGMQTVDGRPSVALEMALEAIDEIADAQNQPRPAIVAAAGNYGNEEKVWPAAFSDRVISVAALNPELEETYHGADWSTRGEWVTCCCVGTGIVSTFVPGDEDPDFSRHHPEFPQPDSYPFQGTGDSWAVWSGTSFAAPQVAGAISRLARETSKPPREAATDLLAAAAPLDDYPLFGKAIILLPGT